MPIERPELALVEASTPLRQYDPGSEARRVARDMGSLDARAVETLLMNLDASLHIFGRAQFFTWTQGLLQGLIPHKVLICALCSGKSSSFKVDSFSTLVGNSAALCEVLLRDAAIASCLMKTWKDRKFLPIVSALTELGSLSSGFFARELRDLGATELLFHGTHDADAQVRSFFIFACQAGYLGPCDAYVAQLAVPFLHSAWIRSQTTESSDGGFIPSVGGAVLTEREREVLRWVYLGKSNAEAAEILGISPLTVKNHMQRILRKLNVVNRAQAVGKALDARIISSEAIKCA